MLFNSVHFLLFFPVVVIVYFLFPPKIRWIWLLAASYYFYMSWNPYYAVLMVLSTVVTYASGILISNSNKKGNTRQKRLWIALSFGINLAILFFFKYFGFAVDSINSVLAWLNIQPVQVAFDVLLPVGISFYTFQALGYTVDIYREELPAERNLAKYALFVSFFPQLVAGPIERSVNLLSQIKKPTRLNYDNLRDGLSIMLWGLFEKIVIADRVGLIVDQVYNNYKEQGYSGVLLAIATVFFAIRIYCDFSGYTDIARGAAKVLGFDLMANFKQPYFATSIRDFWRRWHISLSTWFRDYLYIPLGGNRKGKARTHFNTFITFLVSGLWHGANWTFAAWGALHGIYQILGNVLKPARQKVLKVLHINTKPLSYRVVQAVFTFSLVCFAWIFFRAESIGEAFDIIKLIFSSFQLEYLHIFADKTLFSLGLTQHTFFLTLFCIGVLFTVNAIRTKTSVLSLFKRQNIAVQWFLYLLMLFLLLFVAIYDSDVVGQQFIYFQF